MSSFFASPLGKVVAGNLISLASWVLLLTGAQAVVWFHGDQVTVGANSPLLATGAAIIGLLMVLNVLSINVALLIAIKQLRRT